MRQLAAVLVVLSIGCVGQATNDGGTDGGEIPAGGGVVTLSLVQSTDAQLGRYGRLRITLTNPATSDTPVTLKSSAAEVASLPATASVPRGAFSVDVPWQGLSVGTTIFSASLGDGADQSVQVSVLETLNCGRGGGALTLEVGADSNFYSYCDARPLDLNGVTAATADTAIATMTKASVVPFQSSVSFSVHGVAAGTTALLVNSKAIGSVQVIEHARLVSAAAPSNGLTGASSPFSVTLDGIVADKRTVTMTAFGTDWPIDVLRGSRSGSANITLPAAGTYAIAFKYGDVTLTQSVQVLAAPTLRTINVDRNPVDLSSTSQANVSIQLNVAPVAPYEVTLASSDPSIVSVPATATFYGTNNIFVPVSVLKPGFAVITASAANISVTTGVNVVAKTTTQQYAFNMYLSADAYQVQAMGSLNINNAPEDVALTSSDPTVVEVPALVPRGYSDTVFVAKKVGLTTITATSGSNSASVTIRVVGNQSVRLYNQEIDVAPGVATTIGFRLAAVPPPGTTISFESSNAAVAAAPRAFEATNMYDQFTLVGLTTGTSIITVHVGSASASLLAYVTDGSVVVPALSYVSARSAALQVGASTYVQVGMTANVTTDTPVSVVVEHAATVTVVGTPRITAGTSNTSFVLTGASEGTTSVKVTVGSKSNTFDMRVASQPKFSVSGDASSKVGDVSVLQVSSDVTLAKDVIVTLVSSAPSVASVPANVRVAVGDGSSSSTSQIALQSLTAGVTTITANGNADGALNITVSP